MKEIGKLLCKGQNTEEVHDSDGDNMPVKEKKDDVYKLYPPFSQTASLLSFGQKVIVSLHIADNLPSGYVADILTPPPNRC